LYHIFALLPTKTKLILYANISSTNFIFIKRSIATLKYYIIHLNINPQIPLYSPLNPYIKSSLHLAVTVGFEPTDGFRPSSDFEQLKLLTAPSLSVPKTARFVTLFSQKQKNLRKSARILREGCEKNTKTSLRKTTQGG